MDRLDDIVKLVGSNAVGKKEGHFVVQKYIGKKSGHNVDVEYRKIPKISPSKYKPPKT